jgi:hypothetical protein
LCLAVGGFASWRFNRRHFGRLFCGGLFFVHAGIILRTRSVGQSGAGFRLFGPATRC